MDHEYLKTCNRIFVSETSYRMSPSEIQTLVRLRMSNSVYFSGKRNASMRGWRAILKHMGLHTKMTFNQAAKKWDNMRKKYKELKYPPDGVQVLPNVWLFFQLMDDAMQGRLDASAPVVQLLPDNDHDDADFLPRHRKRRRGPNLTGATVATATPQLPLLPAAGGAPEIEVSLQNSGEEEEVEGEEREAEEGLVRGNNVEEPRAELRFATRDAESDRALMEGERRLMARESVALGRERASLEREWAGLERGRASLERERTAVERERALVERERAVLDREWAELSRERLAMERHWGQGRQPWAGCSVATATASSSSSSSFSSSSRDSGISSNSNDHHDGRAEGEGCVGDSGEHGGLGDPEAMKRQDRFLALFGKLVENF